MTYRKRRFLMKISTLYMISMILLTFKIYMLDPAHFTTSPGLSWSACLRTTKQKLEIPTDPKMHLFFDRG